MSQAINFFQVLPGRLRVNIGYEQGRPFVFFRLIPSQIPEFSSLSLPDDILKLSENKRGIVLVTGPVGTGKSTTLASIIKHIVTQYQKCIVTLEDPIEFVYGETPTRSLIIQREIGNDVPDFATGLRQALRENPDIILVGEMRDRDTVDTAFNAALSGHLILGTVHTISSIQTVERLVSLFPEDQHPDARMQLSLSLKGIVSQALLPRKDGKGRIPCVEILPVVSDDIRKYIREGTPQKIRQFIEMKMKTGAYTFDKYLAKLVLEGSITEEVALEYSQEPDQILQKIVTMSEENG
jgi:twitching motility protein PilT